MRINRAVAALAMASGIILVTPAAAHADNIRDRQWYLNTLGVTDAHKTATGEGVRVGLIDAGIDPEHPDLNGALGEGETFGEAADLDTRNAGTADAAILAGRGHGEDAGILGVAPGAEIVPAEVGTSDADVPNEPQLVAEAIAFLTEQKVDVIAVATPPGDDASLRDVVRRAVGSGIPVVVANGGLTAGDGAFPKSKGVVTAVGTDDNGNALPDSAPAPTEDNGAVTLAAPAMDVPVALPGGDYTSGSDSSFAAMIVAGTIALVKEHRPDLSGADLTAVVRDSASGEGEYDEVLGSGVVDPVKALAVESSGRKDTGLDAVTGDNTMMAAIIGVAGLLCLTALVLIVRLRDRARRFAAAPQLANTATPPGAYGAAPPVAPGATGNMPRFTDTPAGGMPVQQPPPYGQQPPAR